MNEHGCSRGDGWASDSGSRQKREPTGVSDGLHVGYERKRGVEHEHNSKLLDLSSWEDGVAFGEKAKTGVEGSEVGEVQKTATSSGTSQSKEIQEAVCFPGMGIVTHVLNSSPFHRCEH